MGADEACSKAMLLRQRARLEEKQHKHQAAMAADTARKRSEALQSRSEKLDGDLAASRERTGALSYQMREEAAGLSENFADSPTQSPDVNNYVTGLLISMQNYAQDAAACAAAPSGCRIEKLDCPPAPKVMGYDITRIGKKEFRQESKGSKQANAAANKYYGVCKKWSDKMDRAMREMHTLSWNLDSAQAATSPDLPSAFMPSGNASGQDKSDLINRAEELEKIADAVSGITGYCKSPSMQKPDAEPFAQEAGALAASVYALEHARPAVDESLFGGACAKADGLAVAYCRRQTSLARLREEQSLEQEVPEKTISAKRAEKIARASGNEKTLVQAEESIKSLESSQKKLAKLDTELSGLLAADNTAIFSAASSGAVSGFGVGVATSPANSCMGNPLCALDTAFNIVPSSADAQAVLWDNSEVRPSDRTLVSAQSCMPCGPCTLEMSNGTAKIDASAAQRDAQNSCTRDNTARMRAMLAAIKDGSPDTAARAAEGILDARPENIAVLSAGKWVQVYYTGAVFTAQVQDEHAVITVESGSVLCYTQHGIVAVHAGSSAEFEIGILLRIMK
jgi:hypothetical protein